MNAYAVILALSVVTFGCAFRHQETIPIDFDPNYGEKIICERMENEVIPFPQKTPFNSDARKREAYLTGFCKAWDIVVKGYFLHATIGISIPKGLEEPWEAGWKDGSNIGIDRWMQESEKWRKERNSQTNSSP